MFIHEKNYYQYHLEKEILRRQLLEILNKIPRLRPIMSFYFTADREKKLIVLLVFTLINVDMV